MIGALEKRVALYFKRSGNAKKQWEDPRIRLQTIQSLKITNGSSDVKLKRSRAAVKRWEDPDVRSKTISSLKRAMSNPGAKEKTGLLVKRAWEDEESKSMRIAAMRMKCNIYEHRCKLVEFKIGGFWYGNIIYYDSPQYCEKFNREFKERVRAYWGYKCVGCETLQNEKGLHVHHVHYDKKMCCNGSPHDVVPLCNSCHSKTNTNRDFWEDRFTELIYSLHPDGKCFFTKEEMQTFISTHTQ